MSRVKYKGYFFKTNLIEKNKLINKIYNKNLTISLKYIDCIVYIYNGKKFVKLKIINEMIGYKFGEFIYTRERCIFKKKKNGSKNNTNKFKIK